MKILKIKSDLTEVKKIRNFLKENLKEADIAEKDYFIIELSLLEICINIIIYAYPQQRGEILIGIWQQQRKIFFEIRDDGLPFDPRQSEAPDLEEIIKNEKRGGLGIFLARKLMDGFNYKREGNQNILTMHKKITKAGASRSI